MDALQLCYELAYLEGRAACGLSLSALEQVRLAALWSQLARDPEGHRRDHRRFAVHRAATVRVHDLDLDATVVDLSAGGCLLASVAVVRPGKSIKITLEGDDCRYIFVGKVVRLEVAKDEVQLAVAFEGIPLQLRRLGGRAGRPRSSAAERLRACA